jgi:hypothetical protein
MTAVTQTNVAEVATRLRAIVAAIDAGDASSAERAYLVGAVDALENLPAK